MINRLKTAVIFFFLVDILPVSAQNNDFGIWLSAGTSMKPGKWDLDVTGALRLKEYVSQIDRWSIQLDASYHIIKRLKAGLGYEFICYNDSEYDDFQPRQRYSLFLQGKQKFGHIAFSIREKVQRTIKDESDRIKENGNYDNYKINPEWIWRNCLKITYNIPQFPVNPSFAFESFYQLNNPEGNRFEKLRYTISLNYKPAKHHEIELYGLLDQKINIDNSYIRYILGAGYVFSF